MGLDMYLLKVSKQSWNNKKRYDEEYTKLRESLLKEIGYDIDEYDWKQDEDNVIYPQDEKKLKELAELSETINQETVGYWRKFNALHVYISKLKGGVGNCEYIELTKEDVETILADAKKALETKNTGIMPYCNGFFLDSPDYDGWYWDKMENTINIFTDVLNNWNDNFIIYYEAWW